ncbi:hypothetical protein AALP_AA5G089200 [Arabis alpina]|uniref:TF-B3 domain-containing protein n=1 Tax=Arabis alpina TaxID=50452 RepID=A0A087GVV2_ARAAL|nr:hypothetical protein AALP_AA5G089200 [Arabis alpina]
MNTQDSVQSFFRVYMPNKTNDDMNLPFVSDNISGTPLPRKVTVKNVSSGSVWKMVMTTNGESNTVLLQDGWKKIVKDMNLKEPTLLVFEFDGSRVFHFCVYEDSSMCKKMRSPLAKEVIEVDSEESDDDDDVIEEDTESKTEFNESPKRKERGGTSSRRRQYLKSDSHKFVEYLDDKLNPSFPVDVIKERTRIPAVLIRDYNLTFPKMVIVRDKFNKLERKITIWKNGSVFLNGVGSITRRNHAKPGDKMVCELKMVDGYHGLVHEIKVHVIKA